MINHTMVIKYDNDSDDKSDDDRDNQIGMITIVIWINIIKRAMMIVIEFIRSD